VIWPLYVAVVWAALIVVVLLGIALLRGWLERR
jgi:hypothetical protein